VKNLVRHRQIAAPAVLHLTCKTDVVLGDTRQQFMVRHEIVDKDTFAPRIRHVRREPVLETVSRFSAQVNFRAMIEMHQHAE